MVEEKRKCMNPECGCPAPSGGDYCGDYCQDPSLGYRSDYDQPVDTGVKNICYCDHAECRKEYAHDQSFK
jgi:hypothetical protein